jgi:predicted ATPase/class 3 adenylate cyclase
VEIALLPAETVTILFTDLESSTRLWESHPEAMRLAVARHNEILRTAVRSRNGHVIKEMGDGVYAVFARAGEAVIAAADAQLALAEENWGFTSPFRVRIGMHTGEAELRNGDYFGQAVNRAARLMAAAHGGQIVISQATEGLVRDVLPAGFALIDLGEHRLRDLSRRERVFQLTGPRLESRFPPLRSMEAYPGNLPLQLTSFVGREREIGSLAAALSKARLVTLTGVGGVGKTRLALQVAAEVLPNYPDGAWLCELAPVREPGAVGQTVAAVFGVSAHPGQSLGETLAEYLRSRRLLLLLDNCEHLLGGVADLVQALGRQCPELAVLATSREGLGVEGERIILVQPLRAPSSSAGVEVVAESDAPRLFVERAAAVKAGFVLNQGNAAAVAGVCRRLDGIPLALELAAARVAVMSPAELARRLDQRFRTLAGGRRGAVERHQTLRSAIDWSYALLSEPEQRLLGRLAVFAGGCTLEAAEAVAAGNGIAVDMVFDHLASLVAKSLVVADDEGPADTRYRLLETIRDYAEECLKGHGERVEVRRRHARYFTDWVETASRGMRGPEQSTWMGRLNREQGNLQATMAWAIDADNADVALRLLEAVKVLPTVNMPVSYALSAEAESAIGLSGAREHRLFVAALVQAAMHAWSRGDFDRADDLCGEALDAERRLATGPDVYIFGPRIFSAVGAGDIDKAIGYLAESIAIDRAVGDPLELAWDLGILAMYHVLNGNQGPAIAEAAEALSHARTTRNPGTIALALGNLGFVLIETDPDRAQALLSEGLELSGSLAHPDPQGLWLLAMIATRRGDHREAIRLAAQAIGLGFWPAERITLGGMLEVLAHALAGILPEASAVLQGAARTLDPGYAGFKQVARLRDETTDALTAELGETPLGDLRAKGSAMDKEEAIAFARTQINQVLATKPGA